MPSAIHSVSEVESISPTTIKSDFPIFASVMGVPFHYLDNAATTHKPEPVIDAISACYSCCYAPIHRGLYPMAEQATNNYEAARITLGRFIGARAPGELVFTRSATESINAVASGWLKPRLQSGDLVWVSRAEHHSNYLPWQRVCQEKNAELRIIELTEEGQLDLERNAELFSERSKFVAVSHVSNVLGIENPVHTICTRARECGITVLVDAAQSVAHTRLNVEDMGCDFLAFSAHKMFGPAGIGLLYGAPDRLAGMAPLQVGGGMVDTVGEGLAESLWTDMPARFEAGSPDLPGAIGFAAAADYIVSIGHERIKKHISSLTQLAARRLMQLPGISLLPHDELPCCGIVSFTHRDMHPHDIAQVSGDSGVAIRAGHHCAQPLLSSLGMSATARASFSIYNDESDVDALIDAVHRAQKIFC